MNFSVGDRVQWNDLLGTVTRINVLNVKNSCQVTFDDGTKRAFFGSDVDSLTAISSPTQ